MIFSTHLHDSGLADPCRLLQDFMPAFAANGAASSTSYAVPDAHSDFQAQNLLRQKVQIDGLCCLGRLVENPLL